MADMESFWVLVAVSGAVIVLAVLAQRLSGRLRVPAPAFFLVAAALTAVLLQPVTQAGRLLDERIVSVALALILFDGGMHIGWHRFRASAGAIAWLGVVGTILTAAAVAAAAHLVLGIEWPLALLLGAALAPTDPAVVFSVLGRREISGRVGTILEGESGANDPVGISIMSALLVTGGSGWQAVGQGFAIFTVQIVVGAAVGIVCGFGLRALLMHARLPNEALASVLVVGVAALVFGVGMAAQGSGFLAVFIAGIMVGDLRAPFKSDIARFTSGIASMAEIVAFIVLGLTIRLDVVLRPEVFLAGLALSAVVILVVRPVLVGAMTLPLRLAWGERVFLAWTGLKGAVPILLGLTVVSSGVAGGQRLYAVIFIVVLVSVLLQGSLVPWFARLLHIPMHDVERHPYPLDIRYAQPPSGLHRHVVESGSRSDGAQIRELMSGQDAWVSLVSRGGHHLRLRPKTVLRPGDVVVIQADDADLAGLFTAPS